jgi:hypothetical protein
MCTITRLILGRFPVLSPYRYDASLEATHPLKAQNKSTMIPEKSFQLRYFEYKKKTKSRNEMQKIGEL